MLQFMFLKRKVVYIYIAVRKMDIPYQKLLDVYQLFQESKIKHIVCWSSFVSLNIWKCLKHQHGMTAT